MLTGSNSSRATPSGAFSDTALQAAYDAAWMRPSPLRQHPQQRAAAAAAVVTAQRQQQLTSQVRTTPAHNDMADPLTGRSNQLDGETSWQAVYRRLNDKRLSKRLKVFGWRLVHNALWVGARKMHFRPRSECICLHEPCQQQQQPAVPLQTLSHVLLECPKAQEVWQWFFSSVWRRIDVNSSASASQQLLLLNDLSEEVVSQALQPLWTQLRLMLLESLWLGRGDLARGKPAQSASAVKHRFVQVLKQQVQDD